MDENKIEDKIDDKIKEKIDDKIEEKIDNLPTLQTIDTLVLSGGGVKGYYILGAIQSFIDKGMLKDVKNYIGCSVGSIISYLLCIGYTPIEIFLYLYEKKSLEKIGYIDILSMLKGTGASSFVKINEVLENMTLDKIGKFITLGMLEEEFKKNLVCVSYNMTQCIPEYLSYKNYPSLPCLTALRMSCNIPFVFDRFKYMNSYYIDGGIADNFPILKGEENGKRVLGIYLCQSQQQLQDFPNEGNSRYFLKLLQIPIVENTSLKVSLASKQSIIIPLKTNDLKGFMDFNITTKEKINMFVSGYEQSKK